MIQVNKLWKKFGRTEAVQDLSFAVPEGIVRFGTGVRFHDLSGLAKYPVDVSQLPESRIVMRVYRAQDHFTRQLVIPQIRLSDWESIEHNQAENH